MFAADGAFDDTAFRAGVAALGFAPDIPRNPRKTGRPKHRGFVAGCRIVERAHAHLGDFRSVRIRWCRLSDSYRAFLATAAAHRIIRRAGFRWSAPRHYHSLVAAAVWAALAASVNPRAAPGP